jgi:hypothetical protein
MRLHSPSGPHADHQAVQRLQGHRLLRAGRAVPLPSPASSPTPSASAPSATLPSQAAVSDSTQQGQTDDAETGEVSSSQQQSTQQPMPSPASLTPPSTPSRSSRSSHAASSIAPASSSKKRKLGLDDYLQPTRGVPWHEMSQEEEEEDRGRQRQHCSELPRGRLREQQLLLPIPLSLLPASAYSAAPSHARPLQLPADS